VVRSPDMRCPELPLVSFAVVADCAAPAALVVSHPIASVGDSPPAGGHSSGRALRLFLASLVI